MLRGDRHEDVDGRHVRLARASGSSGASRSGRDCSTSGRLGRSSACGCGSSAGSCSRIARCSSRSSREGSIPSSSVSAARVLVGLERLRLPPGAVQGEHQLRAEALAQGMLGDERLELADQAACRPARDRRRSAPRGRRAVAPRGGRSRPARSAGRRTRRAGARARARAPPRGPPSATSASKRSRSSSPRLDAQQVAGRPRLEPLLPSALRSRETYTCSAFAPVSGASSSQRASIRRSVETTSFACRSRTASSARCLAPPRSTCRPSSRTSSGPRILNSIAPPQLVSKRPYFAVHV